MREQKQHHFFLCRVDFKPRKKAEASKIQNSNLLDNRRAVGMLKTTNNPLDVFLDTTRSSACVPAVAGTHAPGRDEGVEGLRRWLGDTPEYHHCSQLLSWVEGSTENAKWWKS